MAINEIPENKPGAPTDLTEKAENTPANPTDLTEVAENALGNPNALTELSESAPGNPSDLAEVSESNPAAPTDLVEVSESTPGNPSNLTELAESTPGNPSNLTEVAEGNLAAPTNLNEIADSTPGNPSNLTEVAENTAGNPASLTLTTEKFLPRTLTPRVNLNFGANNYELNGVAKSISDVITYSRSSSAYYIERFTNQFGQRDYRLANDFVGTVTNLVTYSEQFEEWSASNATVATNKIINPVTNTSAAEKVSDNTTNAVHTLTAASATVTSGATVNLSIRAKAGTLSRIGIYETQSADGVLFDIQSGVIISQTGTPDESSVKYLSGGWYELSATVTVPATSAVFAVYLDSFSAYAGTNEYLYIVGAQITESVKSLPYVKTLSASASEVFAASPRLEYSPSDGEALGYLSEESSTNLLLRSEELSDASWSKIGTVISDNQILAPDDTKSADKITQDGATSNHYIINSVSVTSGLDYSLSVYVKASESSVVQLTFNSTGFGASQYANFNLNEGTVSVEVGGTAVINSAGGGWYRCQFTATATATVATGALIVLIQDELSARNPSYTGDNASGIYAWGAQAEEKPFSTNYIRTEGATVSRSADNMQLSSSVLSNFNPSSCLARFSQYHEDTTQRFVIRHVGLSSTIFFISCGGGTRACRVRNGLNAFDSFSLLNGINQENKSVLISSGDSVTVYLNDDQGASVQDNGTAIDYSASINIGRFGELGGHVRQVSFYDVALTESEALLL